MNRTQIKRNTTYSIMGSVLLDGVPLDLTGAHVLFTAKPVEYDNDPEDSAAIIAKDIECDLPEHAAGNYQIDILPNDTKSREPCEYYYDIVLEIDEAQRYVLEEGTFELDGSPTNRTIS